MEEINLKRNTNIVDKPFNMLEQIETIASNVIVKVNNVKIFDIIDSRYSVPLELRVRVIKEVLEGRSHTTLRQAAITRSRDIYISNSSKFELMKTKNVAMHLYLRSYEEVFCIQVLKLFYGFENIFGTYDKVILEENDIHIKVDSLDASAIHRLKTNSVIDTIAIVVKGKFSVKFNLVKEICILALNNEYNYKSLIANFNSMVTPIKQEVDPLIKTSNKGFITIGIPQANNYV